MRRMFVTVLCLTLICAVQINAIGSAIAKDAKAAAEETAKAAVKKKVTFAAFEIKGSFPETSSQTGLFGDLETSLDKLIARMEKAAESDDVSGILLRLRNPSIGRGKVDELRAAIGRVRKAGTKVYADVEMGTAADYLVACACDEIVMPPSGSLLVTGVRAEVTFYKGLLDNVGVKADFLQIGDFKGAAEPYTRSEMSDQLRQQYESLIDDYYDQMVTTIAADRKLEAEQVKALLDKGIFTAASARKAGLIDRIAYEDEMKATLLKESKADTLAIIKNYGKKKVDTDFSGFTGMVKMMNLLMGNAPTSVTSRGDKIAIVYAEGPIMSGESDSGLLGGATMGSDTIIKALRTADEDEKVKAIVLRVNSPGGSALASDLIWRQIQQCKKPVIASMGDVAASGGYYISMGASKIFAEAGTLTGSIGVVGGKLALGGTMQKVGITTDVISRGKNSGVFSLNEPFSPSERQALKQMMLDTYEQFTSKAAEGRHMKLDRIKELAQGKVYSGRQAKELGLVDEVGTLHDALSAAKKAAGISADDKVDLLILPEQKSFFEKMFGDSSMETRALDVRLKTLAPQLAAPLADVELLQQLFREPVNTVLPYRVIIR